MIAEEAKDEDLKRLLPCPFCGGGITEQLARAMVAGPEFLALAERVARLNRDAGEIGAGMLASLVDEARFLVAKTNDAQRKANRRPAASSRGVQ